MVFQAQVKMEAIYDEFEWYREETMNGQEALVDDEVNSKMEEVFCRRIRTSIWFPRSWTSEDWKI
jgi:hypothetical protein